MSERDVEGLEMRAECQTFHAPRQERDRPPGHYICWCGIVVHSSGLSRVLYETNGDLHKCGYRALQDATGEELRDG
jgi:hypothetical protein